MPDLLQHFYSWLVPIRPIRALTRASFAETLHLLEWQGAALEHALSAPIMDAAAPALARFLAQMDRLDA